MNFRKYFLNVVAIICLSFISVNAQKTVYIPSFITNVGMNLQDSSSQWSYHRSIETENLVIFWEPGFGKDPSAAPNPYKIDMEALKVSAEKTFSFYLDSLKFAVKGSSVTDRYKLMVFLLYTTDWAAFGSGQDDLVGSLFVSPAAANIQHVMAHEIGHCFQYITGCDSKGGFRYGYGPNGAGGNGFWEQCAQWKAYKVFPELQFTEGDFTNYIKNNHLHILHEDVRYANFFLPDYWTYKRGIDFMGRLWRESVNLEDPVEAYKRINSINQDQLNDEMYEHAARLTSWDLPALINFGQNYTNKRAQVKMNLLPDEYWQIDPDVCIENYGYNSIKLNVPTVETLVKVNFKGMAGTPGFRSKNIASAGWKFGFVALLKDGTRVYSDVTSAKYTNGRNPETTLEFNCPEHCEKLWLVVSGAPQIHWKHAWDDDNTNDEQWPYQIKFENTNLLMRGSGPIKNLNLSYDLEMEPRSNYNPNNIQINSSLIADAFSLSEDEIAESLGTSIQYYAINPDNSFDAQSTAIAPGHWFDKSGKVINWGNGSYIYSELNIRDLVFRIGQYPDRCNAGDQITIQQALIYKRSQTDSAIVKFIFNINIRDLTSDVNTTFSPDAICIFPNPSADQIYWNHPGNWILYDAKGMMLEDGHGSNMNLTNYPSGLYFLKLGKRSYKVFRME